MDTPVGQLKQDYPMEDAWQVSCTQNGEMLSHLIHLQVQTAGKKKSFTLRRNITLALSNPLWCFTSWTDEILTAGPPAVPLSSAAALSQDAVIGDIFGAHLSTFWWDSTLISHAASSSSCFIPSHPTPLSLDTITTFHFYLNHLTLKYKV